MTEKTFVEAWYFGTSETEVKLCFSSSSRISMGNCNERCWFDTIESRNMRNRHTIETILWTRCKYIANVETLSISIFTKQSKSVFIRWKLTGRRRRRRRLVVDRHKDPTEPRNSSDSPLLRGKRRLEIRPDGTAKNFIKIVFRIVEISRLCWELIYFNEISLESGQARRRMALLSNHHEYPVSTEIVTSTYPTTTRTYDTLYPSPYNSPNYDSIKVAYSENYAHKGEITPQKGAEAISYGKEVVAKYSRTPDSYERSSFSVLTPVTPQR